MAARLRSRSGEPEAALAWGSGLRWYGDGLQASQAPEEILWLLDLLREERPEVVVEIGTDRGGTLFLWPCVAVDDALLVAIDTRPLGALGRYSPYAIVRRAFAREQQRIELVMPANSHDRQTVERLRELLGDRPIDFLFIDGDHSYDGVKMDFELFSPFVRPGGIVAFHDVAAEAAPDVVRFWNELKLTRPTSERVATRGHAYGIGVVRMPALANFDSV